MDQMKRLSRRLAVALTMILLARPLAAQSPSPTPGGPDTTVVPGAHYRAGGFHKLFFGRHYRDLWTTPIKVPVLDLDGFAGGLRPTQRGGRQADALAPVRRRRRTGVPVPLGRQGPVAAPSTRAAAYGGTADLPGPDQCRPSRGAAGREPRAHRRGRAAFGATAGPHAGFAEVGRLPRRLRRRARHASKSGRPTRGPGSPARTRSSRPRTSSSAWSMHQDERIDARGYLTARLVDLFLGDWDRHQDQWRWARMGKSDSLPWTPIPRDRDQAFARFDGLLLSLARLTAPQLVEFSESYPSMVGLTWNARVLDRRLLSELDWPVWDTLATDLQAPADRRGHRRRRAEAATPSSSRRTRRGSRRH